MPCGEPCTKKAKASVKLLIQGIQDGLTFQDAVDCAAIDSNNKAMNMLLNYCPPGEQAEIMDSIKWQ